MKKILTISLVCALILCLCACDAVKSKEYVSDDGTMALTAPENWTVPASIKDTGEFGIATANEDRAVMVVSIDKSEIDATMDLEQFFELVKAGVDTEISDAVWSTEKSTTIDGFPALTVELTGTTEGEEMLFVLCFIETDKALYQVTATTDNKLAGVYRASLMTIVNSFDEK